MMHALLVGCAIAAMQQGAVDVPQARSNASLVILKTGAIAVYGGYAVQGRAPDSIPTVWIHDGRTWRAHIASGTVPTPGVRADAISVRDAAGRLLVIGGHAADSSRGDVWAWANMQWKRIGDDAPGARHLAAGAYDERRNVTVLHGGHDLARNIMPTTTWLFDGARWKSVDAERGPGARFAAAMAWDPVRRQVLLHGGDAPDGVHHRDTWAWDGARWDVIARDGPDLPVHGAMIADPMGRGMLLIASPGDRVLGEVETWLLEGRTWRLLIRGGPSPRNGHALAHDPARKRVVLFGGQVNSNTKFSDLWEFDGARWTVR